MFSRALYVGARVTSAIGLLLVATLYLLASIPFAYYHFLQFPHFWWMPALLRYHPVLYFAAAAGALLPFRFPTAVSSWSAARSSSALSGVSSVPSAQSVSSAPSGVVSPATAWRLRAAVAAATGGACLTIVAAVPAVQTFELSAALCFVPLAILAAAGVLDIVTLRGAVADLMLSGSEWAAVPRAALAGLVVAIVYAAAAALLNGALGGLPRAELLTGAAVSTALHVALFSLAAAFVVLSRRTASRASAPRWLQSAAAIGAIAIVASILMRRAILASLDFDEGRALLVSTVAGAALVVAAVPVVAVSPRPRWWVRTIASIALLAACVLVLPRVVQLADWGFALQKLLVLASWAAVAALAGSPRSARRPNRMAVFAAAAALAAPAVGRAGSTGLDVGLAVDRYATFDMSSRLVVDLVRPTMTNREFLMGLRPLGEATVDPHIRVAPIEIADRVVVDPAKRPDIYMLVVDSLRPDYLQPYNAAATFTPAIARFADESLVFRRALTPYSGTGLAQPAIWAGGLVPRLMYPKPYAPLNNLERLLVSAGYRRYISADEILGLINSDWNGVTRLDAHLAHPEEIEEGFKFDACRTLDEMTDRLRRDQPREPVFFYSQPQNLHIRLLGGNTPRYWTEKEAPHGFFQPAADAIARIDGCFGRFIENLRSAGRYDNSIVILTADHGDAYGEGGRWGHAFYVAPEILRVPLIVHVPDALRRDRRWNADALAWLTDVTPTLYELLGVPVLHRDPLAGTPLLTRTGEAAPAGDAQLVQSSYGRIYGFVDADARILFTADANRAREDLFDLTSPKGEAIALSEADRIGYERLLTKLLTRFNEHYGVGRAASSH